MKTWLITGASSGLGRLMSERLLERGDRVVATVRREQALEDLQQQYGDRLLVMRLDLAETASIAPAIATAFARVGRIDVVVSNAAYGLFGAAEELSDAQIARQIATNLTGSIQLIRAVIPHLRQQGGGRIAQISSEGGQVAYPNFSLYHASKWGIEGFVEAVRQEVASFGIELLLVEPGPTVTNFASGLDIAAPLDAYRDNASGQLRRAIEAGDFAILGDAGKCVAATLATLDQETMPLRLALGSTAYQHIEAALEARLAELRAQRALAFGADA